MSLQNRCSRACDFSALASQVAGCTDQVKAAMRCRKVGSLRKCSLSGCLLCAIDIHHGPLLALSIPHSSRRGSEYRSCHQIFLKECAQRLHGRLIQGCKKAGKGCRMRQLRSPEKCHERVGKRKKSLIKGL